MSYRYWRTTRLSILGFCSLGILLSLGVNLLAKPSRYKFPELAIDDWEAIDTDKIKHQGEKIQGIRSEQKVSGDIRTVEVYYLPNYYSNSNNKELIRQYRGLKAFPKNLTVIKNDDIGSYGLYTEDKLVYLNTCIHSHGKIAFTNQQFAKIANQNINTRLLPWFLGLSDLRNWDCLWVNMTITLDEINETEAHSILNEQLHSVVSKIYPKE